MKSNKIALTTLTIFLSVTLLYACKKSEPQISNTQDKIVNSIVTISAEQQAAAETGTAAKEPEAAKINVVNTAEAVNQTTELTTPAQSTVQPKNNIPDGFALINGGIFNMGSPDSEQGRTNEEGPQHTVEISSFYMAKYPVTQAEYAEIMGTNPSNFKGARLPVEQVDWFDAIEYCNKKSKRDGLSPVYVINKSENRWTVKQEQGANGYRLPTEAQWEYACRAGTVTPFSTGANINTNQANYSGENPYDSNVQGENRRKTTPVGSFPPNPWGLYDMHRNVFEWCWDWYGIYKSEDQTNPDGPVSGIKRVYRGGSWMSGLPHLRSAYRYSAPPSGGGDSNIGFRLALKL
jgi:formylglycine-generating enzyme required for sulfatase activity